MDQEKPQPKIRLSTAELADMHEIMMNREAGGRMGFKQSAIPSFSDGNGTSEGCWTSAEDGRSLREKIADPLPDDKTIPR